MTYRGTLVGILILVLLYTLGLILFLSLALTEPIEQQIPRRTRPPVQVPLR